MPFSRMSNVVNPQLPRCLCSMGRSGHERTSVRQDELDVGTRELAFMPCFRKINAIYCVLTRPDNNWEHAGIQRVGFVFQEFLEDISMSKRCAGALVLLTFALSLMATVVMAQARSADIAAGVAVQEGTKMRVTLDSTISTKSARPGDRFTAMVREPIYVDSKEVIPYGSQIEGRVSQVERPGRTHGMGKLDIVFEKIQLPNGYSETIVASAVGAETTDKTKVNKEGTVQGPSSRKRDAAEVAAGGGIGAGMGAIAGGAKGTAIGAGVGALIGLADSLRRHGKDLELPAGTTLVIRLDRPLTLQPPSAK